MNAKTSILSLLILVSSLPLFAQITVTGTVIDAETKEPLVGAVVRVPPNGTQTITDLQGQFKLEVPQNTQFMMVTFSSYAPKKISLEKKIKHLLIELMPAIELDEVVVTGIVPTRKEKHLTYSAQSIQMESFDLHNGISPHTYNTEDYGLIRENIFHQSKFNPLSTFSIDVDAASYSNIRRFLNDGSQPPKDAVRIEEMINYFQYDYEQPFGKEPFSVYSELGDCPWQPGHKLLHIGLQGKKISSKNLPASNLVFLLDVSGSMQSHNKLPLVKSALKMLVNNLREEDRVSIVVYAGSTGLVLPSTSGANKAAIVEALDQLTAGGSTAGAAGIQLAYQEATRNYIDGGNNRVILATDGDFNVGISSDAQLVRLIEKQRTSGVFLSVLGFGTGNLKDNKMEQLAQYGNGQYSYIDNLNEAKKVLVNEYGGSLYTIAKDVKLQIEFNPAIVAGYRLIGYENRLLNNEDFNDDNKDAGDMGAGHTVTALYEIIPVGVQSPFLKSIDELTFQNNERSEWTQMDWANLKIRYKKPDGVTSKLLTHPIGQQSAIWDACSVNYKWAAAVAAWGMYLQESEYIGIATPRFVLELGKSGLGEDHWGYRQEMLKMIRTSGLLANK